MSVRVALILALLLAILPGLATTDSLPPRVLVSTDIGGTDPDDFQSMVHLLLYADQLEVEGLISSPFGPGRKEDILRVIDCYEQDLPRLREHSPNYPDADALRAITKQGETERAPFAGVRKSTEGSRWIAECARRDDPRSLHLLVWGGLEDLAQALHDAPGIVPKLRVYWIGGPNKKWSPDAYQFLVDRFPELWIIETNSSYRGWFVGGDQSGQWGNREFVRRHVAGHGALGDYFAGQLGGELKMGDSPSVGWILSGDTPDPAAPGWGGRFVRAWERPFLRLESLPSANAEMETFGILELRLPVNNPSVTTSLEVTNQLLTGDPGPDKTLRFRFSPKASDLYEFTLRSDHAEHDGRRGAIRAVDPPTDRAQQPSARTPHWWTDDLDPSLAEDGHAGAATVSRWRREFLGDFAARMDRCLPVGE